MKSECIAGGARRAPRWRHGLLAATVWLAACGGGGGGGGGDTTAPPPAASPNAGRVCVGGDPGWCWQAPLPGAEVVRVVRFFDDRFGMVAGDAGYLQRTLDGGETWTRLPRTDFRFLDVAMVSTTRGWARSENDLLLFSTRDGGVSWERSAITLPNGSVVPGGLTSVLPLGGERLILTAPGAPRALLTEDAGATWTTVAPPHTAVQADGLYWSTPVSSLRGQSTEFSSYDRVTAFGREQQSMEGLPSDCAAKVLPIDRQRLRAYCSKADLSTLSTIRLFQSDDGGLHWTPLPAQFPAVNGASWTLRDVALDAAGDGFGVLSDSTLPDRSPRVRLLRASAGGSQWQLLDKLPPAVVAYALPDRPVLDDHSVWLIDAAGDAWLTGDRGANWRRISVPPEAGRPALLTRDAGGGLLAEYLDVQRNDAGDIISADNHRFYRSSDGGQRWWRVPGDRGADSRASVEGLWFHDARNGLALVSDGSLRSTDDGGRTWQRRAADGLPPTCCGRTGLLQFAGATQGWMLVGGVLKASSDGGRSFAAVGGLAADLQQLVDLQFLDAQQGWTVSASGRLYRSLDAGRTWAAVPQPAGAAQRVHFIDERNGLLVLREEGDVHSVWHTTDGGQSWNARFGVSGGIRALRHADAQNLWMVGERRYPDAEYVWRSSDGGRTWRNATPEVPVGWSDLRFADPLNGWLIGGGSDGGLILATRDGGQTWTPQAAGMLPVNLRTVFWLDARTGWIGGDAATILSTTTGGR